MQMLTVANQSTGDTRSRRLFRVSAAVLLVLSVFFALVLTSDAPQELRATVSSVGLLLGGVLVVLASGLRAYRSSGLRRRAWTFLLVGAILAITANLWSAITGSHPVSSPNLITETGLALALVVSIAGVLSFPALRRRGVELLLLVFDGVVVGGALLVILSVLLYSDVLRLSSSVDRLEALVFPLLDAVLATVALLLVARSSADRLPLTLIGAGFVLYACSDTAFAMLAARGTFEFGTVVDLGWILGYLMVALAATCPTQDTSRSLTTATIADTQGTILIFSILLIAAVVQTTGGSDAGATAAQTALWVVLVFITGTRQVILGLDNAALRRGLERRVEHQTADLRRLARQTEVLLTSVVDGIYGVDDDGRITFINPAGAVLLGSTADALTGQRAHQAFHAPTESGAPHPWQGCYITQSIRSGIVASAEEDAYVRADGSQIPVEITCSPLMDGERIQGAVVAFRDITQRREVDRLKHEFLSVVSHELRTPLTSIRGSLGLLAGGALGDLAPSAQRMVSIALESSERLTRLINDILDMERIESGSMPMNYVQQTAGDLVHTVVAEIDGLARSSNVRVEIGSTEGRVMVDSDRIVQALTNLIGNAIKFSVPGGVVRVGVSELNGRARFQVSDEGRGIPEEKLETIFERFEQVDSSDTRQKGGSGLGLAISRGIVERHGGRIWAESEMGVGTVVSFELPAVAPPAARPAEDPDDTAPLILVCDDDSAVVETLSEILRQHGYRPIGVTDGEQAVESAIAQRPAAVLMDLLMPGTSGAEVVAMLRKEERTRHIPIVVVSGLGPTADPQVASSTDGWLTKPITEERLANTIAIAVAGRRRDTSVLIVEDDPQLAAVLTGQLHSHGLDVSHARTVAEAVERAKAVPPQVIVLDVEFPDGVSGDVMAELRRDGDLASVPLVVYNAVEVRTQQRDDVSLGHTVVPADELTPVTELEDRVLDLVDAMTGRRRMSE